MDVPGKVSRGVHTAVCRIATECTPGDTSVSSSTPRGARTAAAARATATDVRDGDSDGDGVLDGSEPVRYADDIDRDGLDDGQARRRSRAGLVTQVTPICRGNQLIAHSGVTIRATGSAPTPLSRHVTVLNIN